MWKKTTKHHTYTKYISWYWLKHRRLPHRAQPSGLFNQLWLLLDNITAPLQGTKMKVLNYNEVVEIVFQGINVLDASEDHPVHLHGYTFYVIGLGHGNFDNATDPKGYNLVDPPKMNIVSVPKKGWAALRFKSNNPAMSILLHARYCTFCIHYL